MKERPILFSGPMVRAILSGAKTQTRRAVKPQPVFRHGAFELIHKGQEVALLPDGFVEACSPFQSGCHLWVKETFLYCAQKTAILCRADMEATEAAGVGAMYGGWKPSIFMPRTASRITLEITSVRVERLREISMADVLAEGCILSTSKTEPLDYQNLWDSINGKKHPWSSNPFIWRIEFKPLSRPLKGANA